MHAVSLASRTESSMASARWADSHGIDTIARNHLHVDITPPRLGIDYDFDDLQVPPSPTVSHHSSSVHFHTSLALRDNNPERRLFSPPGLQRTRRGSLARFHASTVSGISDATVSSAGVSSLALSPHASAFHFPRVLRGSGKDDEKKKKKKRKKLTIDLVHDKIDIGSRFEKLLRGWGKFWTKKPRTVDDLSPAHAPVIVDETLANKRRQERPLQEPPVQSRSPQLTHRTPPPTHGESANNRTELYNRLNKDLPELPHSSSADVFVYDNPMKSSEKNTLVESEKDMHPSSNFVQDAKPTHFPSPTDPHEDETGITHVNVTPILHPLDNVLRLREKQNSPDIESETVSFPAASVGELGFNPIPVDSSSVQETHPGSLAALACAKLKIILEDKLRYRTLVNCEGTVAQKILDVLQMVLDYPLLDVSSKNSLLIALLRLSKRSGLYPRCLTLKGVQRGEFPITAGAFGEIWKGRFHGQTVCLKMVKVYEKSHVERLLTAFSREAIVWRHVSHPNLLPFYGIYRLEDAYGRICLVSPWMENGNINLYLEQNPDVNRLLLVSNIISGIAYLHENNIIHGDLKGANILVTSTGRACVTDFGLSTVIDADILKWTSVESTGPKGGTVRWLARELVDPDKENVRATRESDMYAFACVCYEVFTGRVPYHEATHEATVMFKVMRGDRPSRPCEGYVDQWGLTDGIWTMMEDCWRFEPLARPTAQEVIRRIAVEELSAGNNLSGGWGPLSPVHFRNAAQDADDYLLMDDVEDLMCSLDTFSGE